jgi:hypothetical protein
MALQFGKLSMEGKTQIAMGTFDNIAASGTDLIAMVSAPVEKNQRLFAPFAAVLKCFDQRGRKVSKSAR